MSDATSVGASTSRARLGEFPMLDGLRAVAAGMVLLTHTGFDSGEVVRGVHGAVLARFDFGVAIFFVLSGFLLYRPFADAQLSRRPAPSVRRYFVRRALRILPAYWLALTFALLATSHPSIEQTVANAGLAQVYAPSLLRNFTQTWSLSTEVAFYLVLPLLAVMLGGRRQPDVERFLRVQLGALAAFVLASWVFVWLVTASTDPTVRRMNTWLPGHLDWFALGMGLAVVWTVGRRRPGHWLSEATRAIAAYPGTCLLAAVVLFWLAATPLGGPRTLLPATPAQAVAKELLYALCAGCLVLAAAFGNQTSGPLAAALANPTARYLGRISYAIFLWHLLVLQWLYSVTGWALFTGHFLGLSVLTAAGTVAVAAASWRLLERPLMDSGFTLHRQRMGSPGARQAAATVSAHAPNT